MKVNIGPYLTWWGPYQIADLLKYVGVSEDRCWVIGKWLSETWVGDFCQWIYDKRQRTVKIRIDKYDSWNADSTIALIAAPLLKQLKATNHGMPGGLVECPEFDLEKTRFYNEVMGRWSTPNSVSVEQDEADRKRCEEIWGEIQDEMIFALEAINDDKGESQFYSADFGMVSGEKDKITNCTSCTFTGEVDREGLAAYHKRVNNGLVLFGRYFQNLWD
jgi:hypothetical protein